MNILVKIGTSAIFIATIVSIIAVIYDCINWENIQSNGSVTYYTIKKYIRSRTNNMFRFCGIMLAICALSFIAYGFISIWN